MAKRKAVAHVEHSEPVPQSDAEVVATAMAQRVHSCMTRLLEVLARIRRIPSCQREDADFCLQCLRECEGVLLGNAEQFTRTEAVFRLHILRHSLFDSVLMQPSDDEATRGLWTAFVLQLRAVLVAVAKEYGRDVKRLLADRGSEWADLESDARVRDIRAGRVPDPAEHASLFRKEREVNGRSFSIWVALSQEYKAIDAELQRLANEYPETECRQKINELREACEPRLRWAGITGEGPETVAVTTPPADPSSEAKPGEDGNASLPSIVPRAVQYLIGWPEILDRIGQPDEAKDRIAQFNRDYSGPIITRQGAAPKVDAAELVVWWNGLKDRWREESALTDVVSPELATYQHGRTETVVPEIGGHETKRVKGRNA